MLREGTSLLVFLERARFNDWTTHGSINTAIEISETGYFRKEIRRKYKFWSPLFVYL
jgi:hypothetical protein